MITNIVQSLYNMVDAFYLGKLGKVKFSEPPSLFPSFSLSQRFPWDFQMQEQSCSSAHESRKYESAVQIKFS